jgi:SpoVK/Ycf46/Vps4 family AAA+-type ATPase
MSSDEILQVARLALEGNPADVRLYLAKLVRKARKSDPKYASKLEDLLKSDPARSNSVMRKTVTDETELLQKDDLSFLRPTQKKFDTAPLLDPSMKDQFQQIIQERNFKEALELKGLKPASSMIFQGPPGVGKTMTASWLAHKLGLPLYVLDLTSVMSSLLGKTGSNLRSVIDFAKSHPCVLFLDEIDAIAKRRSDESDVGELKRLVNIMLQELEDWPPSGLLIAATNHPELVDPALWRRFDLDISFPLPNEENIREAVTRFLGDDLEEFSPVLELLVESQKDESYSNIKRTINKLRRLKLISPNEFEERIVHNLLPDFDKFSRPERIALAVKLVSDFSFSKLKAAKLLGVSRDTIRKKLSEAKL